VVTAAVEAIGGCRASGGVGVRRGRREDISRGDDGRHKPLELHERRAADARRQRPRGHRVYAVSVGGRPPAAGQLHGGGPVPATAGRPGRPGGGRRAEVAHARRQRDPVGAAGPGRVRQDLRPPGDEGLAAAAPGRPRAVRRRHRRAVPVGLRVVRGRPAGRAAHFRHGAAGRRVDGTRAHRPRGQPRHRVASGGRSRGSQDARAEAEQLGAVRVHERRGGTRGEDAQVHRAQGL